MLGLADEGAGGIRRDAMASHHDGCVDDVIGDNHRQDPGLAWMTPSAAAGMVGADVSGIDDSGRVVGFAFDAGGRASGFVLDVTA